MNKKVAVAAVLVLAIAGYFLLDLRGNKPAGVAGAGHGVPQRTATVIRGDLVALVSATGKIEPIQKVEVKSKASGQIIAMPVEEGYRVQKNALIARIDETDVRNAYEQAVADLGVAKATVTQTASNVRRQEELFRRGLISEAEMDQVRLEEIRSKSQLIKAETELSIMETRLKDCVVRSPIPGIILQKNVEAGQIISSGISSVSGGTLIATVAGLDSVFVYAEVDEVDIGLVKIGQTAKVVPDAFADDVFAGSVLRIAPLAKVEQNVTTFNVTVVVPNPHSKLKAGMNATVDVTVADRRDVLLVPKEAVKDMREIRAQMVAMMGADSAAGGPMLAAGGRPNVPDSLRARWRERAGGMMPHSGDVDSGANSGARKFILVKDGGRFVPRAVELGVSNFDFAEIINGVKEGETVLVFSTSRAAADRQAFMDRMRNVSGFGGFAGGQRSGGNR